MRMGSNVTDEKEKKMFIGVIWSCAAEIKILCTALLLLCSLLTIFQFFPSRLSFASVSDLRRCISVTTASPPPPPPPPPPPQHDQTLSNGVIKRSFNTKGVAAYNFILMSAYRGGPSTFVINGLSSKPLHVFGNPSYQCEYIPNNITNTYKPFIVQGNKILPDWGYGRVYTVVVINCTFPHTVGENGGKLVLHATTNGGGDTENNLTDTLVVLDEGSVDLNLTVFNEAPKYDYLYCGSPLYGNLSPQRVREWIAYHVMMFGEKSHFVIHDAGGIHPEVMEVLRPWMEKGFVTLQDIRDEERFDGYYHNQFLVVNDCLHRYRFMAKWMFFFDVDEFIYVPKNTNLKAVVDSLSEYTQFTIQQRTMSNKLCHHLAEDGEKDQYRKWGFEKLVYMDTKRGVRRDRKYAIQPRNVYATGVHLSQNFAGKTTHKTEGRIMYYHYHGTISERNEPCRQLVNETNVKLDATPYVMDTTMRDAAPDVKRFELKIIGSTLQTTRQ